MSAGELRVRSLTDRLLSVARVGDLDGLAAQLATLIGSDAPRRQLFEPVLLELVSTVVTTLRSRASRPADPDADPDPDELYYVDVLDADDEVVDIDEVQPALRAVLRAVLAGLNANAGDVRFQVGLVGEDPDPLARLDAVVHALLWANALGGGRD